MKVDEVITHNEKCTGCHACQQICPKKAIHMSYSDDGFLYPVIDENICVDCGLCGDVCPIGKEKAEVRPQKIYSMYALDEGIVERSSSGGIFKLIADSVIALGGVVFGACFCSESKEVRHCSTEEVDLSEIMRSKYLQSRIGNSYCLAAQYLQEKKKVLFSGTPCQIRGLLNYLEARKINGDLITVDFVCHGVPSVTYFQEFLLKIERKLKSRVSNVTFREKDTGWHQQILKVYLKNGLTWKRSSLDTPIYYYFVNDYSLRESCYRCDEYRHRVSDITLADDWFSKAKKNDRGTSLVFENSEKGKEALSAISSRAHLIDVTNENIDLEIYSHKNYDHDKKVIWQNWWKQKGFSFVSQTMFYKLNCERKLKLFCRRVVRKLLHR